jgi:hypothetical protein
MEITIKIDPENPEEMRAFSALVLNYMQGKKAPEVKTEVKQEPVKTEPAKTKPAKTEPAKTEPAKTEPDKNPADENKAETSTGVTRETIRDLVKAKAPVHREALKKELDKLCGREGGNVTILPEEKFTEMYEFLNSLS